MPKFRKRPVVIDAKLWDGSVEILNWADSLTKPPYDTYLYLTGEPGNYTLRVHTLEGDMQATVGDMVILGVQGELYFCKPDIFEKTYEAVNE